MFFISIKKENKLLSKLLKTKCKHVLNKSVFLVMLRFPYSYSYKVSRFLKRFSSSKQNKEW